MRRREFITLLGSAAAWPLAARAQLPAKRALIAMLVSGSSDGYSANVQAFRRGLHELHYTEGRDLEIAYRYADGDPARMPALATELVKLKPDVIVTTSTSAAQAAKQATTTVPIVSSILTDPLGNGLAASEARPGGNVTGIQFTLSGLTGKQLELAREVMPQTSTVGLLVYMKSASNPPQRRDAETDQLGTAFQVYARQGVDWVIVLGDALFNSERDRIASLAISLRIPTIFSNRANVEAGGLISYGVDLAANHHRAAYYVDKILKGAKAGNLPIEFPTKLELAINLNTAKTLGLKIPPRLVAGADEVIE